MQRCPWIEEWVLKKVECFLPKLVPCWVTRDEVNPGSCQVLYFPDQWSQNTEKLLQQVKLALPIEGMVVILEASEDDTGLAMCHKADYYQKALGMRGIVDRVRYRGNIKNLKGKEILIYQFWLQSQTVGDWLEY